MTLDEVKQKIENGIEDSSVEITGDGCNCAAIVISKSFTGLSMLKAQKMVLATVNDEIKSGELHALSIKTRTE